MQVRPLPDAAAVRCDVRRRLLREGLRQLSLRGELLRHFPRLMARYGALLDAIEALRAARRRSSRSAAPAATSCSSRANAAGRCAASRSRRPAPATRATCSDSTSSGARSRTPDLRGEPVGRGLHGARARAPALARRRPRGGAARCCSPGGLLVDRGAELRRLALLPRTAAEPAGAAPARPRSRRGLLRALKFPQPGETMDALSTSTSSGDAP